MLTPGKAPGPSVQEVIHKEAPGHLLHRMGAPASVGQVLSDREMGEEEIVLRHPPYPPFPRGHADSLPGVHPHFAAHGHPPLGPPVNSGQRSKESALSPAGGSEDGDPLSPGGKV